MKTIVHDDFVHVQVMPKQKLPGAQLVDDRDLLVQDSDVASFFFPVRSS